MRPVRQPRNNAAALHRSLATILCVSPIVGLAFALAGCGAGNPASDLLSKPPAFSATGSSSSNTGLTSGSSPSQTSNAGLKANQQRLTVELPTSLASGTAIRQNLVVVKPSNVQLVKLDTYMDITQTYDITYAQQSDDSVIVTIPSGTTFGQATQSLPDAPEYAYEVTVNTSIGGQVTLWAPAASSTQDIRVNAFSDYLVRRVFTTLTSSELSTLDSCLVQQNNCINTLFWNDLSSKVQDFEIDIPNNVDESGALDYLAGRADFTNFISGMKKSLLLPQSNLSTFVSAGSYNMLMFAPELNAAHQTDGSIYGQWGIRMQTSAIYTDSNGASSTQYPTLTFASTAVLGFNLTTLSSDIPYIRETELVKSATDFSYQGIGQWQTNSHSTNDSGAAGLSNDQILAGRSLLQTISNAGTDNIIGWAPNPYYMDAYLIGGSSSPYGIIDSFFHGGKALKLASTSNGYQREGTLEDDNVAGIVIGALKPSSTQTITPATLDGQKYNTVELAMDLNDSNGNPAVVTGRLAAWSVSSGSISESSESKTTLTRNKTGTIVPPTTTGGTPRAYTVENTTDDPSGNSGRLSIKSNSGDTQSAITNADGSLLAMSLEGSQDGQGIVIGVQQATSTPTLAASYELQGVDLGLDSDSNTLEQIDQNTQNGNAQHAILNVSGNTADLYIYGTKVTNTLSSAKVSDPQSLSYTGLSGAVSQTSDGQISIAYTNGDNNNVPLSLKGYVSPDGKFMILQVIHGNSIGLFFGYTN